MASKHLRPARTFGERALKVDHAGEHGAVCIYRAQRWVGRWRAPALVAEIDEFKAHEERHRRLFAAELARRGIRRCRSYHLCGLGGLCLGLVTALIGPRAIALTTEAIESVVLSHLVHQLTELDGVDPEAASVIQMIITDEEEHHDKSADRIGPARFFDGVLQPIVRGATEGVIRLGMRL